jgi:hypothetical protein
MEFIFNFAIFWLASGIIAWVLVMIFEENSSEGLGSDAFLGALLLGPIIFIIFLNDKRESKKWEEEYKASEIKRKEKSAATKKKKKDKALNNLPEEVTKAKQFVVSIQNGDQDISDDFFDCIENICSYCTSLTKKDIKDKQEIHTLMLFSRESLEIFYKSTEDIVKSTTGPKIAKASGVVGSPGRKSSKPKPKPSKKDKIKKKINSTIKKVA